MVSSTAQALVTKWCMSLYISSHQCTIWIEAPGSKVTREGFCMGFLHQSLLVCLQYNQSLAVYLSVINEVENYIQRKELGSMLH